MDQRPDPFNSISDRLRELVAEAPGETVTVRWLLEGLSKRAFGFLILFLAIPNVIPMPPGVATIFGTLLLFPSIQLLRGMNQPWFPRAISQRTIKVSLLRAIIDRAGPWLDRIEPYTHERLVWLIDRPAEQAIGAVCFVMALILMLPILLGHLMPGLALFIIAIGMIQRDGLILLLSLPFVGLAVLVTFLNYKALMFLGRHALGLIGLG